MPPQVAGLVGRAELLSAIFFVLSFMAYTRAVKTKQKSGECVILSIIIQPYTKAERIIRYNAHTLQQC